MTIRVVQLDPDWFGDVEAEAECFEAAWDDVVVEAIDCEGANIPDRVGQADILLSHYTDVDAAAMDTTGCSVVTRYATGIDGIDVEAATNRGVRVTNVPEYCEVEVAEHVIALALAFIRGIPTYSAETTTGTWDWRGAAPLRPISELTMGFLAYGRKAREAADRAKALGFDVQAHDPFLNDRVICEDGAKPVTFDELLETSDVLSINAPLTVDTKGIIDADAFSKMPENAILVNAARGGIVDEAALLDALDDGHIAGAGLDVLEHEPPAEDDPLLHRDDVIVTPHAGWYSTRSTEELRRKGSTYAIAAFRNEISDGLVNRDVLESHT